MKSLFFTFFVTATLLMISPVKAALCKDIKTCTEITVTYNGAPSGEDGAIQAWNIMPCGAQKTTYWSFDTSGQKFCMQNGTPLVLGSPHNSWYGYDINLSGDKIDGPPINVTCTCVDGICSHCAFISSPRGKSKTQKPSKI